jgi:hypothetical protein
LLSFANTMVPVVGKQNPISDLKKVLQMQ